MSKHSRMKYDLLVTDQCNLRCKYCIQHYKDSNKEMSLETAFKYIDMIVENHIPYHQYEYSMIQFTGGEPLLRADFILKCMDYFEDKIADKPYKYYYFIPTNGTLFGDPKVRELIEKYSSKLSLGISIDGYKEMHDSLRGGYDTIIKGLPWVQNVGLPITVMPCLSADNANGITDSIKHLVNDLNFTSIYVSLAYDDPRWAEDSVVKSFYEQLLQTADFLSSFANYRRISCSLLDPIDFFNREVYSPCCHSVMSGLAVDYQGKLWTCYRFRNPEVQYDYSIGNVDDWIDKKKLNKVRAYSPLTVPGIDECTDCNIGSNCKKCIGLYAQQCGGDITQGTNYMCKEHHARFYAMKYYMEKKAAKIVVDKRINTNFKLSEPPTYEKAVEIGPISQQDLFQLQWAKNIVYGENFGGKN